MHSMSELPASFDVCDNSDTAVNESVVGPPKRDSSTAVTVLRSSLVRDMHRLTRTDP